jgi:predicted membrane protein
MDLQSTIIPDTDNQININSVFSSIDKPMISKDFKGGKINNMFASTELDLSDADLTGMAVLNVSQLFGEITLIVPADWHVETDISQLFATVDDYRENKYSARNSDKVLAIKGTSVFANIEIHNNV